MPDLQCCAAAGVDASRAEVVVRVQDDGTEGGMIFCFFFVLPVLEKPTPLPAAPRSATVNELMLAALEKDATKLSWTASKWAETLGASKAAVTKTAAWRRMMAARALEQAGFVERRRAG